MTRLQTPDPTRFEDWLTLLSDFGDGPMDGSGFGGDVVPDPSPEGFRAWVRRLAEEGDPARPPAPGRVKCSYFWITDDTGNWVGHLALRRTLNDFLLEQGGHIGYSVRPSRRREGHAANALALAVGEAAALGLDRVLVTCDEDNVASRATIEGRGGVYEDSREGKRRYWIPTTSV